MASRKKPWDFTVYALKDRPGFTIKYYDGEMKRLEHRIPAKHSIEKKASQYAQAWIDEQKALSEPTKVEEEVLVRPAKTTPTFKEFAETWTSGELARMYFDHVDSKKSVAQDIGRLERYIYPVIGHVSLSEFEENGKELAHEVMSKLPSTLTRGSRRHVAQLIRRVLNLAVEPTGHLRGHPLAKGWLPKKKDSRALNYLYPADDRKLLGKTGIPLAYRVLFGFLSREGLRAGEALGLEWRDLDLDHGVLHLDENKTSDPRSWALDEGVVIALRRWKERYRPEAKPRDIVFLRDDGTPFDRYDLASELRWYLQIAGIDRPQLFTRTPTRVPMRVHDLRGTFVTLALASGKSETWVMDRSGHRSSQMVNLYRRVARSVSEAKGATWLDPLHEAIPELARQPRGTAEAQPSTPTRSPGRPGPVPGTGQPSGPIPPNLDSDGLEEDGEVVGHGTNRDRKAG